MSYITKEQALNIVIDGKHHMIPVMGTHKLISLTPDGLNGAMNAAIQHYIDTSPERVHETAKSGQVPDGMKLVPIEPTLEMSVAFAEQFYSKSRAIDDDDISDWYSAMLAAAPEAP